VQESGSGSFAHPRLPLREGGRKQQISEEKNGSGYRGQDNRETQQSGIQEIPAQGQHVRSRLRQPLPHGYGQAGSGLREYPGLRAPDPSSAARPVRATSILPRYSLRVYFPGIERFEPLSKIKTRLKLLFPERPVLSELFLKFRNVL
jgi:hypothetical protein